MKLNHEYMIGFWVFIAPSIVIFITYRRNSLLFSSLQSRLLAADTSSIALRHHVEELFLRLTSLYKADRSLNRIGFRGKGRFKLKVSDADQDHRAVTYRIVRSEDGLDSALDDKTPGAISIGGDASLNRIRTRFYVEISLLFEDRWALRLILIPIFWH